MTIKHPASPTHITPAWLTATLGQQGQLHSGRVINIQITPLGHSNVADHYRLQLAYSNNVQPDSLPQRFFFKWTHLIPPTGDAELLFYQRVLPIMQQAGQHPAYLLRSYATLYDAEASTAQLLLEDVSHSHIAMDYPSTHIHYQQIIDAFAAFHAFWWERDELSVVGQPLTAVAIDQLVAKAQETLPRFLHFMGDRLTPAQQQQLHHLFTDWPPRRRQRTLSGQGQTLVHRDTHPANFLYARLPEKEQVRIIDWQALRVATGTDDLAYMMAFHWYPARRKTQERPLLQRYHTNLLAHGVTDYSWHDCWDDYRASIIRLLFLLIGGWQPQRSPDLWWHRIHLGLLALNDLDCMELMI